MARVDVFNGISDLLTAALPSSVPVLNLLTTSETELDRHAQAVCVLRESIDFDAHPELNPETAAKDQLETWTWVLYVKGGGGATRPADRGAEVGLFLDATRAALNAQRATTNCGPLHVVSEDFEGHVGTSVMYAQTWRHRRLEA